MGQLDKVEIHMILNLHAEVKHNYLQSDVRLETVILRTYDIVPLFPLTKCYAIWCAEKVFP